MPNTARQDRMAHALRFLAIEAVERAKSGHPGLPMGAADIATALFVDHLKFDAADPDWPDRDRFVLSAGHGSALLYALLHLLGYAEMNVDELKRFRQLGSRTAGHPERGHAPGIETTTGPLGQGLANAVGMALAERLLAARFGKDLVDHRTYVLCSDGDLMEGISHEAAALAGHLKLSRLIVFHDDNGITIDGALSLADSVDQVARFEACGWDAIRVDGHDQDALSAAIADAQRSLKPSFIACRTVIGFGAPTKSGKESSHGSPLGATELAGARKALGWDYEPFVAPNDVRSEWSAAGSRGAQAREAWTERLARAKPRLRAEFERVMSGAPPKELPAAFRALKREAAAETAEIATRKTSERVLDALTDVVPELISGSADLSHSNFTRGKAMATVSAGDFSGRYIHYGIREHAMAAAMNGMALHGGLIPASGTFLVFADYCRPSLRLAALMGLRVIHVMTHDSIGVGEDGPTHQPVEHLASLRAIPNLNLFRPCDLMETVEAYEVAFASAARPSVFALSRQNLPQLRKEAGSRNLVAQGAYELLPAEGGGAVATLFASGSEVAIAAEARAILAKEGLPVRLVSAPCLDLFLEQPEAVRRKVLGRPRVRVVVEAGISMGWDAVLGEEGVFVGMRSFGASGPYKEVYEKFGITAEAVAEAVRSHPRLARREMN